MIWIYIYDKSWTAITQIYDAQNLTISQKINQISEARFTLPLKHPDATRATLKKYNRIKITQEYLWAVKTIFDGVISARLPSLNEVIVICKDKLHVLERSNPINNLTTTASVGSILSTVLNEINTEEDTGITLDCSVSTSKAVQIDKTTNYFQILQDVAKWSEYIVIDNILYVSATIGADKTSSVEFRFDVNNPWDNNIADAKMEDDGKNLANDIWVKWTGSPVRRTDPTSIAEYGRICDSISISDNNSTDADSVLEERKDGNEIYTVEPSVNDFWLADLWDIVSVNIISDSDLLQAEWTMRIIEKRLEYRDTEVVKYVLWNSTIRTKNIFEKQKEIEDRLKKLELS